MSALPRLYAIADASFGDPVDIASQLFVGGARLVQLRNKAASSRLLLEQAASIVGMAPMDARVIVNDRADIARIAGASGVHLGQDDLPVTAARRIIGDMGVIGLSTHDEMQAGRAASLPLDYLAVGPIFKTVTKTSPAPALGLERLAAICRRIDPPVVAIGGITLDDVQAVLDAGANAVAVISDLLGSKDVPGRTRLFLETLNGSGFV